MSIDSEAERLTALHRDPGSPAYSLPIQKCEHCRAEHHPQRPVSIAAALGLPANDAFRQLTIADLSRQRERYSRSEPHCRTYKDVRRRSPDYRELRCRSESWKA